MSICEIALSKQSNLTEYYCFVKMLLLSKKHSENLAIDIILLYYSEWWIHSRRLLSISVIEKKLNTMQIFHIVETMIRKMCVINLCTCPRTWCRPRIIVCGGNLPAFAGYQADPGIRHINHKTSNLFPAVSISLDLSPGLTLFFVMYFASLGWTIPKEK